MKAIEINEDNLEDLLTYDDLFLDYFNAFLSLPVFPQPLYYNRLTGTFLEVNDGSNTVVDDYVRTVTPPYGATDEEREHMLEWAKDERLPLFLRTQLFREFKLCKLLLRPLDDHCSASRGSSGRLLRGYSRQTESYVSSFSNSADNSANDADFEDENMWCDIQKSALFQYRRPGSRAISLPTRLGLAPEYTMSVTTTSRHTDTKQSSNVTKHPVSAQSGLADRKQPIEKDKLLAKIQSPSSPELLEKTGTQISIMMPRLSKGSAKSKRASDSRHSSAQKDETKSVVFQEQEVVDFDAVYGEQEPDLAGETYVNFGNDVVSDQQTETDVKELEGKHKMSFQQMKEQVLGSASGMEQLKRFLVGTVGGYLFNFWLDCENFKDTMEDYDDYENMIMTNALFRDIQDRYKLALTEDAKRQIAQSANNAGLSHTVFIRTQYDVLRRLRAYWVPRFLIHKERLNELSEELNREMEAEELFVGVDSMATSFFPSISLVNSMPVRAEQIMQIASCTGWESISKGGRKLDDRIKSAKPKLDWKPTHTTLRRKFGLALLADKAAGGPFKMFLETYQNGELLNRFLFWEAVTEYGMAEDRSADRLLRMCHAWIIFNRFISKDGPNSIGVSPNNQDYIHQALLKSHDFVEASIFNSVQQDTVEQLEKAWIRFLKEDLKAYLDCQVRLVDSPPSTADEIEVYLDEEREHLIVRRPRPWTKRYPPSTESERGRRLRTALSMAESIDEARRAEIRQRNRERRKMMEKERRKAVRAAMRRLKEAKMKKNLPQQEQNQSQAGDDGQLSGNETRQQEEEPGQEKTPTLQESFNNKVLIQMFKKYLADMEGKDAANLLNLCLDIEAYYTMMENRTSKHKKDTQATHIYKSYLEQGARKKVPLSDEIYPMLSAEKERPRTATLKEIQSYIMPKAEELFSGFLEHQAAEMGLDNNAMANMSKAELAMRADDSMLVGEWAKKKRNGKDATGALPPLNEEDAEDSAAQLGNISSKLLKLAMSEDDFVFKKVRKNKGVNSPSKEKSDLSGNSRSDLHTGSENQEGTESGRGSLSPSRRKHKADGRAQPTKEDKVDFLLALNQAAAGNLPIKMWYFYKYLVKHGDVDGVPFVDKDLFFYCEVHKFKDCNHQYADDELLKRKVQSLLECYLECSVPPHCQLDIPPEIQQKTVRAAQRYLAGKDVNANIFDEAQYCVFKELLPYWAGFQKNYKEPRDAKTKPLTKKEKERLKRLQEMMNWKPPSAKQLSLPMIPKGTSIAAFTFTLGDGIRWREGGIDDPEATPVPPDSLRTLSNVKQKSSLSSETLRSRRTSILSKA